MQIYFFTMKNIYLFIVSLFFFYTGCDTQQTKYPFSVETVLAKAGNNRKELEKALDYFYKQGDSIKIKAIEFLVAHITVKLTIGKRAKGKEWIFRSSIMLIWKQP